MTPLHKARKRIQELYDQKAGQHSTGWSVGIGEALAIVDEELEAAPEEARALLDALEEARAAEVMLRRIVRGWYEAEGIGFQRVKERQRSELAHDIEQAFRWLGPPRGDPV